MSSAPPTDDLVGYSSEELRAFLEAVDRRIAELRSAIATARATQQDAEPDAADAQPRFAGVWVAAWHEAEMIRAGGEREARAIIDAARRLAGEAPVTGRDRLPSERTTGEGAATDPQP